MTVTGNPEATYWNGVDGYRSDVADDELYPYRVYGSILFNSLQVKTRVTLDESFEYCGYFGHGFILALHRYVFGSILFYSMQIKAQVILDASFIYCGFFAPDRLLLLHRPDEMPEFDGRLIRGPAENAVEIVIKPRVTITGENNKLLLSCGLIFFHTCSKYL